jgi:phosphoenolpyruvate-protein phosphotransferase/dihydroxyacetone kinase phosphotransfer subunit
MIGFVVVSHSARLAAGVCELAAQMAQDKVRLAPAGGTSDPANPIGTDAFKVLEAIESVYDDEGVLVFTDLGSAILSAETAIQFLDEARQARVRLYPGPVVEGAVSAVSLAAAGAGMAEILDGAAQGARPAPEALPSADEVEVALPNPLGLHARPAAQLIRIARRFEARITVENLTKSSGPADAASLNGLLALGGRQGHVIRLRATGPGARQALDELRRFIESGCGDTHTPARVEAPSRPASAVPGELSGIGASAGIAVGPLVRLHASPNPMADRAAAEPEVEWQRLLAAIHAAHEETRELYEWARAHAGPGEAGIFDAQSLFLEDPSLLDISARLIRERSQTAEAAWQQATAQFAARLEGLDDPYLRARAADVADVAARVLRRVIGLNPESLALEQPAILTAHSLMPSEVEQLDTGKVLGLCLETGSASAHSSILVRSMGIPAVVGAGPGISAVAEGTVVALDGESGQVWIAPGPERVAWLAQRRENWLAARQTAQAERRAPALTRDGRRIRVLANLNRDADIADALNHGGEGVGVLRTEFLFVDRREPPGEEEQYTAYRTIARALGDRPLVIRTLDIGGDKGVPYIDAGEEANPFLGWRGIRISLDRRDILRTQLRAILRAGRGARVEVLFPMVSALSELREAKAVLAETAEELKRAGIPYEGDVPVGVMIEVPAAVAIADQLAGEATRLSIGTNDLIQYVMAADRTNARVAPLADPFQPAVLRMIRDTVQAARKAGVTVDLCGEMAADPLATALLVGLGLEEFSVSAPLIPELKRAIRRVSVPEAEALAREALGLKSSAAVRRYLADR